VTLYFQIILLAEGSGKSVISDYKPFIWAAAIALLALFLLQRTQRRVARGQQDRELSAKERVAKKFNGSDIYSQISGQMAQLAELSRQINGQIDTRVAKLEILIAEAERSVQKLEKLTGKSAQEITEALANSHADQDASSAIQAISEKFKKSSVNSPTDTILPLGEEQDNEELEEILESGVSSFTGASNNQEILDLADSGLSAVEIAQKLNRPVGEIELVLSLSGKKTKSD
jgi:uncharacterized protein DUF6115